MPGAFRSPISSLIQRFAPRLRYPYLFLALLGLFVADLVIPDPIPFMDEAMLALLTVLLGTWRTRRDEQNGPRTIDHPPQRNGRDGDA